MAHFQPWSKGVIVIDPLEECLVYLNDAGLAPVEGAPLMSEFKAQVCCYFVNDYLSELVDAQ